MSDAGISSYVDGDSALINAEAFDYGIKWTDFGSPQYRHQVRCLHIDVENFHGKLIVEHYIEQQKGDTADPVQVDTVDLTTDDTKVVVKFRAGKMYKYGFRLRGYTFTNFKIHSIAPVFDTHA